MTESWRPRHKPTEQKYVSWFTATMGTERRSVHEIGERPQGEVTDSETKKQQTRVENFEQWFENKGGILSYATSRGLANNNDEGEPEGLFASEDVSGGDIIMSMPLSHIMCAST